MVTKMTPCEAKREAGIWTTEVLAETTGQICKDPGRKATKVRNWCQLYASFMDILSVLQALLVR